MKKLYTTIIKWHVVNMRAKDKQLPKNNSEILYVSEVEGFKPAIETATVRSGNDYTHIHNGICELPVSTGFKWCYADEFEIIENEE